MHSKFCPVCNCSMRAGLAIWHFECDGCGYEMARFQPAINEVLAHEKIDETSRATGLQALRVENFNRLLEVIVQSGPRTGRLLDVGCAHGWFLEAAKKQGFDAVGIEPDLNIFKVTTQRELSVRQGYFPDVLGEAERFDVIVFNDVFEHIPDMIATLNGCKEHLTPNGVLVLNLPSSSGFFYRIARLLMRLHIKSFFERLWQKGLPSPHLHYFSAANIQLLLHANGFEEVGRGRLASIRLKGLFTRISYTKEHALPVRLLMCLIIAIIFPFTLVMPSDIIYSISRKN
ncbi:bifunctional 2-polyprenyl-6-hydroxyphenol methylase/3-demethylubiquinol 3-O-methyltransferase UbiG [Hydrogenophaga sp.]|uniref:class I SAM-dependent methyltransferase n=1 Tax=Hydrogenophaga sp. TaxID=1904254 RepID=UPI00272970AC|nr:class I SAM-dependent methyltransferase [Hydrogenophaga sp.]